MTIEELQSQLLELKEQHKAIIEENNTLKTTVEQSTKRISDLQEHNQKLFLKVTNPQIEKEKEEKFESKLLGDYVEHLTPEQIEILKELESEL